MKVGAFDMLAAARALPRSPVGWLLGCLGATVLWFVSLGHRSLFDPDEGRYAEIPREMLLSGDWIIPHLNGLVYLEKPPLQYWLTALSFRCLGETDWAARCCTGIAGYLSLVLIFFLGRRLWGLAAGIRAVLLTSASTLFVLLGHQLTLDMLLSFCLLACLACFLAAQLQRDDPRSCRRWMLGCWAAMGFAVLTKGLIGVLIPTGSLACYVLWQRDWRALRTLHLRWGVPLLILVAAPWFVLASRSNRQFLEFFFIREHFLRFLTPIEHRTEAWWFFIPVLALGILPWAPLASGALVGTWRGGEPRGRFDPARVLWVWSVFVFVFFSLSNAKLIPYILPAVPALALLCARPPVLDRRAIQLGAVLSLAASMGILAYADGAWSSPNNRLLAGQMLFGLGVTAGVLAVSAVAALVSSIKSDAPRALLVLCSGWFLASAGLLMAASEAQRSFSGKEAAELLKSVVPAGSPVYSVRYYEQSLPFYFQRRIILVDYRDEFALGLDQDPHAGISSLQEFADHWRNSPEGYAIMRPKTRDLLAAQGLPMREVGRVRRRVVVSRR